MRVLWRSLITLNEDWFRSRHEGMHAECDFSIKLKSAGISGTTISTSSKLTGDSGQERGFHGRMAGT